MNDLFVSEDNLVALLIVCVGVGPLNVEDNLSIRVCWLLSVGSVTVASASVSVSVVTDFLRNILADSHRNFLVFLSALLAGNCLTLLQGLVVTHLVRVIRKSND